LEKFAPTVREGGIVLYDSSVITQPPSVARGVKVYPVPCATIAQQLGSVVVKNVVALGALQEATKLLDERSFLGELGRSLKHKASLIPLNEAAFAAGVKAVRESR
jgi:Pyruvate/2-oxoacid:ferredoxin oxidoreductase gamma subunit